MVPKVILASEAFAAYVAGERSLVRVRPLVDQQIVGLREVATAVAADVLFLRSVTGGEVLFFKGYNRRTTNTGFQRFL